MAKAKKPPVAAKKTPRRADDNPPNDLVAEVQTILDELGYKPGPVDGNMSLRVRVAVRSFESDHGLQSTGKVTVKLFQALMAAKKAGQTKAAIRRKS